MSNVINDGGIALIEELIKQVNNVIADIAAIRTAHNSHVAAASFVQNNFLVAALTSSAVVKKL